MMRVRKAKSVRMESVLLQQQWIFEREIKWDVDDDEEEQHNVEKDHLPPWQMSLPSRTHQLTYQLSLRPQSFS